MTLGEALEKVIDEGIEAARIDYATDKAKREGSVEGFQACRGKSTVELGDILHNARLRSRELFVMVGGGEIADEEYWKIRCFELEVEWVCNVMSAILMNQGLLIIITPTARGVLQAAKIVGIKETTGVLNAGLKMHQNITRVGEGEVLKDH